MHEFSFSPETLSIHATSEISNVATMRRINEREERNVFHRDSQVGGQHDVWAQSALRTFIHTAGWQLTSCGAIPLRLLLRLTSLNIGVYPRSKVLLSINISCRINH